MKNRRAEFRPSILDVLEDRAVPSTGGKVVHASSTGSSEQARLAQAGAGAQAAYAAFATSVRQSELTLVPAVGGVATGDAGLVSFQVAQEISTLANAVGSTVQGVASGNAVSLLRRQLNGASPGSLASGLAAVIAAASAGSASGTVASGSLPLLFTAVDEALAASYNSTAIEISLDVTVHSSGGSSGAPVNTVKYGNQINPAYANFATGVRQAESTLVNPGGPTAGLNLAALIGPRVQTLANTVTGATPSPYASLVRSQLTGGTPAALNDQLASLIVASAVGSPDGSVPESSIPLLFAAIDAAIGFAYNASAVEGNLLSYSPPLSIQALNGKGADTTIFSSYGVFFDF